MGEDPLEAWPAWPVQPGMIMILSAHKPNFINQSSDLNKLVLFQKNVKNE